MDKSRPLDVILHLDYVPFEIDFDNGWNPTDVESFIRELITREIDRTSALELESIETIEP